MKTTIEWIDPKEKIPPFNKRILVLLEGLGSTSRMKTWNKYATIMDAIMTKKSPNDDGDDETSAYEEFEEEDNKLAEFGDYQFFVHSWYRFKYEGAGEGYDSDWFSDAILKWADMPDFSEAIAAGNGTTV